MKIDSKIYVAGASGLVGSSIVRELKKQGFKNIFTPTSKEYNLIDEQQVLSLLTSYKPDYIFLAAALHLSPCHFV